MADSITTRLAAAGLPPLPRMAWLELDLDALRGNLAVIRALVGPDVAIMPVVKGDAYGHGALPIARSLEAAGADGFCVATMDEAVALRAGGISRPIKVLYPPAPGSVADAAREGIAVAGGDLEMVDRILAELGAAEPSSDRLAIELEIETGLGRGGVDPADAVEAALRVGRSSRATVTGLWTHLQAAEDLPQTTLQLERLAEVAAQIAAAGVEGLPRHVAASGGLLTGIAALDGIRPGLVIYGILPDELIDAPLDDAHAIVAAGLRPVMSLHAQPVRVADVRVGDGVSYGPTWRASRPSRIATLPLGYGDGYTRAFSNRGTVLVRGHRAPVVGRVSMDAIMVDVTDVPGPPVTTDDAFVLLGTQGNETITVGDLAHERTTNRWETVTQMAARLPRVYDAASAPVGLWTLTERRG